MDRQANKQSQTVRHGQTVTVTQSRSHRQFVKSVTQLDSHTISQTDPPTCTICPYSVLPVWKVCWSWTKPAISVSSTSSSPWVAEPGPSWPWLPGSEIAPLFTTIHGKIFPSSSNLQDQELRLVLWRPWRCPRRPHLGFWVQYLKGFWS